MGPSGFSLDLAGIHTRDSTHGGVSAHWRQRTCGRATAHKVGRQRTRHGGNTHGTAAAHMTAATHGDGNSRTQRGSSTHDGNTHSAAHTA